MDLFIVWDVGQGSWSTIVAQKTCVHFDMGGQVTPQYSLVLHHCKSKANYLALSHLDRDHVVFIKKFSSKLNICLIDKHLFPLNKVVPFIKKCNKTPTSLQRIATADFLERNDSHVYLWKEHTLITGDLPQHLELKLLPKLAQNKIRFLLVGHHGSKTSSHPRFIAKLSHLHQALVSAKQITYGHPHQLTRNTFKKNHVPLIETQAYGTLIYEL
ncbi:MAG: hypothetical protein IT287_08980 [Bdellovibrionaceae bacterium]|nr:hypothetical protein [Pseudobdellovibrionaceae bacterium]